jgi:tripartite ATP-independent transporter DctP family solute receptor
MRRRIHRAGDITMNRRHFLGSAAALAFAGSAAADGLALRGASNLGNEHVYTRTMRRFFELVTQYAGQPVATAVHPNGELGADKDYFIYMNQGISVDAGIVSPAHMATFARTAPLMDLPFLFRDVAHWERALAADALKPIADEIARRADVMVLGYAGGGVRHIVANRPVANLAALKGLKLRVQAAPIHTRIFQGIGAAPSVIAYQEVYNAIQSGVINGLENEAAGIEQMKFYEVAPHVALTSHNVTVRPLCFSGKTFRKLPPKVQDAVLRAGREAAGFARKTEVDEDAVRLAAMAKSGRVKLVTFTDRAKAEALVRPIAETYVKQVGAEAIYNRIRSL